MHDLIALAERSLEAGERPFAAAVVGPEGMVASTIDRVFALGDPTAHAEVVAIREACRVLGTMHLRGYRLYTTGEPCVMCCGAVHWAKVDELVFAVSQASMQLLSGGTPKPSCRDVLPLGARPIGIVGPILEPEALAVMRRYDFVGRRT
jgi:tRNA(Arg) A34 adenosine deaminase TadA